MRGFLALEFPQSLKETYAEALVGFERAGQRASGQDRL